MPRTRHHVSGVTDSEDSIRRCELAIQPVCRHPRASLLASPLTSRHRAPAPIAGLFVSSHTIDYAAGNGLVSLRHLTYRALGRKSQRMSDESRRRRWRDQLSAGSATCAISLPPPTCQSVTLWLVFISTVLGSGVGLRSSHSSHRITSDRPPPSLRAHLGAAGRTSSAQGDHGGSALAPGHRIRRVHGPARSGEHRGGQAARVRLRVVRPLPTRARSSSAATCSCRSTRGRSRLKSIASAPSW